jgi:prophage regulatory protein
MTTDEKILRKPELRKMVALSDPTIWRLERAGKFPKRVRLGEKSCGWLRSEILAWIEGKAAERGAAA